MTHTDWHFGSTKMLDLVRNDQFGGLICDDLSKIVFGHVIHVDNYYVLHECVGIYRRL